MRSEVFPRLNFRALQEMSGILQRFMFCVLVVARLECRHSREKELTREMRFCTTKG